jgi:hypothetical protein
MEQKWNLLNIYGAPKDDHKDEFLSELATFCSRNKEPYLVGGDFNILWFFSDKNKKFHPNRSSDTFNAIIHLNELRDIKMSGEPSVGQIISLVLLWRNLIES